MFHWLHHLINPHCNECHLDKAEEKVCQSCETLKIQLTIANREKDQMLQSILSLTKPADVEVHNASTQAELDRVKPKMMTWNVRKQMLEAEDRKLAAVMAEQNKKAEEEKRASAISKLESEVGLEDEVSSNA